MFTALDAKALYQIALLMKALFAVAGVAVIGFGIWKMAEATQRGNQQGALGIRSIFIGGALISIGPLIGYTSESIGFGLTNDQFQDIVDFRMVEPLQGGASSGSTADYAVILTTFFNLIVLFGYWSVAKGMLMFKKVSDGVENSLDEGALSAITHILFGTVMVNIRTITPEFMVVVLGFDRQMIETLFKGSIF